MLREALALADDERADLAAELLASLDARFDDPLAIEGAWAREIELRARRAPSSAAVDWPTLRRRVASQIEG